MKYFHDEVKLYYKLNKANYNDYMNMSPCLSDCFAGPSVKSIFMV